MVEVIRINALQTMVNYRTPTSFLIRETYPLPPYSTVVGMIHNICGFDSWRPMKVSVQGQARGLTSDLFIRYSFANKKYESDRHNLKIPISNGEARGVSRGIAHTELLCDVQLTFHIQPERIEDFESVLSGLKNPRVYPSLGRHEDLLDITSVDVVKVETQEEVELERDMFVPVRLLKGTDNEKLSGTIYLLHKEFEYDAKNRRRWKDTIETRFIGREILSSFAADEDGFPVALA